MNGDPVLYKLLEELGIVYEYVEHPPAPTVAIAKQYWAGYEAQHCKNLFFRNHKGNRHYLVILDCDRDMNIRDIEQQLHQGKLSFASEARLMRYLGVLPGSVTPLGLINDKEKHVSLFIDDTLQHAERLTFHPGVNTASLIIKQDDFIKFLEHCGNPYQWMKLY